MVNSTSFLIGCVGAIAPEILRLYKLRSSIRLNWSWGYVLVSIPFMLLGGFVAHILELSNNYAAFYAGISTPFIINAIVKETQQANKSQDISVVKDIPLASDAAPRGRGGEDVATRGKGISDREKEASLTNMQETQDKLSRNKKQMNLQDFFRAL
ncbi:hypothetical protein Xen7305DRAFT_00039080 [Xenococcus sp. PCC 7305]|uniref:hypothetical protein n=1 Tax=Xenococcus sp. PCC 7305 TaxID=102125 RepID=UPI0002ACACE1|nr:hypothetical protein [Xenococcus sp. PCC 7305]ELS04180.1 hypothetical protein Xen7305DRAFT_00039080 [Xenococcus sp. PCC 7305]